MILTRESVCELIEPPVLQASTDDSFYLSYRNLSVTSSSVSSDKGDSVKAKVLYDFDATEEKEVSVLAGQVINYSLVIIISVWGEGVWSEGVWSEGVCCGGHHWDCTC